MITYIGTNCPLKNSCHRALSHGQLNTKTLIDVPYNSKLKDCDEFWLFGASRQEYISFIKIFKNESILNPDTRTEHSSQFSLG